MSYIISDESGTCAALPLRDSWGTPLTVDHWTAQVEQERPFPPLYSIRPTSPPVGVTSPSQPACRVRKSRDE